MSKSRIAALIAAGSLGVFAAGCSTATNENNANATKPANTTTAPANTSTAPANTAATNSNTNAKAANSNSNMKAPPPPAPKPSATKKP